MSQLRCVLLTIVLLKTVESTSLGNVGETDRNPVIQQLILRVNSLEAKDKMQQKLIAGLQSRDLEHSQRFTALEDVINYQQQRIHDFEDVVRKQQHRMNDLEYIARNYQQQLHDFENVTTHQKQEINEFEDVVMNYQQQVDEVIRLLSPTTLTNVPIVEESTAADAHRTTFSSSPNIKDTETKIRRQSTMNKPAFTVVLDHHDPNSSPGQFIVYDHIVTNIGNAYNPNLGIFTAPLEGTYVFYITLTSPQNKFAWCSIVVNGATTVDGFAYDVDTDYGNGSQMLVVSLKQGDEVAVQNRQPIDMYILNGVNTFSGYFLH